MSSEIMSRPPIAPPIAVPTVKPVIPLLLVGAPWPVSGFSGVAVGVAASDAELGCVMVEVDIVRTSSLKSGRLVSGRVEEETVPTD
jgi:hypothetical protein